MAPKSNPHSPPDDQSALTAAVHRLADLIEILAKSVEGLITEVQWQNNERSQDYHGQHLPLTSLPRDPTTRHWHPTFGDDQPSPFLAEPTATTKSKSSRLFD